jgi:hypothetical protein
MLEDGLELVGSSRLDAPARGLNNQDRYVWQRLGARELRE